jgi:hypothetical protein
MRPNSIVNWFVALFKELELDGCSLHSGRRAFITGAARNVGRTGGSLRMFSCSQGISRLIRRNATSRATRVRSASSSR